MLSILYYIFTVIHTTVWCVVSVLALAVTYPFRQEPPLGARVVALHDVGILRHASVSETYDDGLENIDRRKPYVMVLNHTRASI